MSFNTNAPAVIDTAGSGGMSGPSLNRLIAANGDPRVLQPWVGDDGRSYITQGPVGNEESVITNAPATLRKDAWITLDEAIVKAAKSRLRAVQDLRDAGLTFNLPNGMATTVLQRETMSDITPAILSIDGIRRSEGDRVVFELGNLPIPICHKDFSFPMRQILASQQSGTPIDTATGEEAGRRVAELLEQLLIGTAGTFSYGGGNVFGYTNFPDRLTKVMTIPTSINHDVTVSEVLEMIQQSKDAFHFGPFFLYYSNSWGSFVEEDYSAAKGDNTLRDRLLAISQIDSVEELDFLPAKTMVLVEKASNVVRSVEGMDITTVQWETSGGFEQHFKVLTITVPDLRSDFNLNTGIVHGTHA